MNEAPEPGPGVRRAAAFVAVATFAAARDVAEAIEARRRGAHPSEMRPEADLRRDLSDALDRCGRGWRHLMRRLYVRAADADEPDARDETADTALVADVLLTAQRLARDLHRLHQHLLGLVATGALVEAAAVEATRHLAVAVASLADAEALPTETERLALVGRWQAVEAGVVNLYG